jgi:hypothetical protein
MIQHNRPRLGVLLAIFWTALIAFPIAVVLEFFEFGAYWAARSAKDTGSKLWFHFWDVLRNGAGDV